jgi:Bacterial regulatory proteins, gntR family
VGSRPGGGRIGPRSPVRKSFQLRDILLELMSSDLTADDPIPSERELKQRFRPSRMPVRQAIDRLGGQRTPPSGSRKAHRPPHPSEIGGDI